MDVLILCPADAFHMVNQATEVFYNNKITVCWVQFDMLFNAAALNYDYDFKLLLCLPNSNRFI